MKSLFRVAHAKDFKKVHLFFWAVWIIISAILVFSMHKATILTFIARVIFVNLSFFYSVYFPLKFSKTNKKVNYPKRILYAIIGVSICYLGYWYFCINIGPSFSKEATPPMTNKEILTTFFINYLYFFLFGLMFYFFEDLVQQKEEVKIAENKRLAAEADFLRAQINPHFLLNTLNFLYASASLGKSKELASSILKLSDIMRFSLTNSKGKLIPLKDELHFINSYIELNQMRFNNELAANLRLPSDAEVEGVKIVPMVLITVVENAFKHGELLEPENPVQISLEIDKNAGKLRFYVKNKKSFGPKEPGHGIGIENSRARLQEEYGDQYSLTFNDGDDFYEAVLEINPTI